MFEAKLEVKLECPVHPEFDPQQDYVPRRCNCCQAIEHVATWIKMARNKARAIEDGFYQPKAGEEVAPVESKMDSIEDIADVVTDEKPAIPSAPEPETPAKSSKPKRTRMNAKLAPPKPEPEVPASGLLI